MARRVDDRAVWSIGFGHLAGVRVFAAVAGHSPIEPAFRLAFEFVEREALDLGCP